MQPPRRAELDRQPPECFVHVGVLYGGCRIDEIDSPLSGDRNSGMVSVTREGTGAMVLGVVKEDDGWKLDQR